MQNSIFLASVEKNKIMELINLVNELVKLFLKY